MVRRPTRATPRLFLFKDLSDINEVDAFRFLMYGRVHNYFDFLKCIESDSPSCLCNFKVAKMYNLVYTERNVCNYDVDFIVRIMLSLSLYMIKVLKYNNLDSDVEKFKEFINYLLDIYERYTKEVLKL